MHQAEAKAVREATINDRLNKLAEGVAYHCERIESVLARVNGTPTPPTPIRRDSHATAQIQPAHSMVTVVDSLEQSLQRLANLATGVEGIA